MQITKPLFIFIFIWQVAACNTTPKRELRDVELRDAAAIGGRIAAEKLYDNSSQGFPLRVRGSIDTFKSESAISLRHNTGETRALGDAYILEGTNWTAEEGDLIGVGERREAEVNHEVDITRYSAALTLLPVRDDQVELDLGMGVISYDFNLKASGLGNVAQVSDKGSSLSIVASFKYFIAPELAFALHGTAYRLSSETHRDIDLGLEYQALNWLRLNLSYFTYSGVIGRPEVDARYIVVNDFCLDNPDDQGKDYNQKCLSDDLSGETKIEFNSFSGIKVGATYTF